MEKIKIAIVILHYLNYEDTVECIDSILSNMDTDKYRVIVIDNASPNGSGMSLEKHYEQENRVKVLINKENLGFSGGNNVGIKYVKDHYNTEFLILSNNDIILYEKDLSEKIVTAFQNTDFAVMGPMILNADGRFDSNPIFDLPYTKEMAIEQKKDNEKKLRRYKSTLYPFNLKCVAFMGRCVRKFGISVGYKSGNRRIDRREIWLKQRENVILHGCFLIFSKKYFELFDGLDARTFMYVEEDILYQNMKRKNAKILYNPDIIIFHKEGQSVKKEPGNDRNRKIVTLERQILAIQAYIKFLDDYNEK